MTAEATASRWLELAVTCDTESVEPVSELFASHGFNQGVAIEEAFTQDPDGDNFAIDPTSRSSFGLSSMRPTSGRGRSRRSGKRSGTSAGSARSAISTSPNARRRTGPTPGRPTTASIASDAACW